MSQVFGVSQPVFKTGAVAFIDVLGFKGIWRRYDPRAVLSKLARLKEFAEAEANRHQDAFRERISSADLEYEVRFLSDTIVLTCSVTQRVAIEDQIPAEERELWEANEDEQQLLTQAVQANEDIWRFLSLGLACASIASAVSNSILLEPYFAYRGCVHFGDYEVQDNFVIGPAVDECAEQSEEAEGAFVYLTTAAGEVLKRAVESVAFLRELNRTITDRDLLPSLDGLVEIPWFDHEFHVPLHHGRTLHTHVLDPLCAIPSDLVTNAAEALLNTFSSQKEDVLRKRENTSAFLNFLAMERTTS